MASRKELLAYLWTDVIDALSSDNALDNVIAHCKRKPLDDTGPAIERLLNAGTSRNDLRIVLRATAYEAVFGTLYALGDPGVDGDDVFMLHEELCSAEPSATGGRTGSADSA